MPLNIRNSPTKALVSGKAILASAIITNKIARPVLFVQARPAQKFSCTELSFYQFYHYPQPNNINTMIEHLYHHTLHTNFIFSKNGQHTSNRYAQWKNKQPVVSNHPA